MPSQPGESGISPAPTHGPDGDPLYERQPTLYHRVESVRKSAVVRVNGSAPMQVVETYDRAGDRALLLTAFDNTLCKIASNGPILVYSQAYLETLFYRQWDHQRGEFGELRPVDYLGQIPNPTDGVAPAVSTDQKREAAVTYEEMYASRDARIQAADR